MYLRAISKYTPPGGGLYLEGRFNGGCFAFRVLGGLYLEGLIHGGAYFRNFTVSTILDKSPWDCTAIFIFFCYFSVPSKSSASFSKFSCSSPSPPTLYKIESRKKSGYTRPTLFVGWGEGLDLCELENAPGTQKCPKTFFHDCSFTVFFLIFFKLWDHCNWITAVVVSLSN